MLECVVIAGHLFIASSHLAFNITDGISMVKGIDDGIAVYVNYGEARHSITIRQSQLEELGFVDVTSTNFLNWCYDQVKYDQY